MRDIPEDLPVGHVPAGPVGAGARAAIIIDAGAVGVVERQRAPLRTAALVVLVPVTCADYRVGAEIGLDNAVPGPAGQAVAVEVAVGVEIGAHRACPNAAIRIERNAYIAIEPQVVERSVLHAARGAQIGIGALADEVDHRAGIAGGREQPGRAAYNFDAVVDRCVERSGLYAEGKRQSHPVDLEGLDVEPAGRVVHAVGFRSEHAHTRNGGEQRIGVVELEILDLGAGYHADRLRCLALAQRQTGRRGLSIDAIFVASFRTFASHDDRRLALLVQRLARIGLGCGDGTGGGGGQQGR